jgi:hypothetical protein
MNAAQYTIENGGGTFRASDLTPVNPTSGYAVAVVRGSAVTLPVRDSLDLLTRITWAIEDQVQGVYGAEYIGTWIDNGIVHIDPVVILPDYGSAVIVGRAFGQDSIYSFLTGRVISLAGEPSNSYWLTDKPVVGG